MESKTGGRAEGTTPGGPVVNGIGPGSLHDLAGRIHYAVEVIGCDQWHREL